MKVDVKNATMQREKLIEKNCYWIYGIFIRIWLI